jgi:nitroreductase|tara:strand:- start:8 stop:577 length:570 start_codon:yes stop_codon:yes gene_type:complete
MNALDALHSRISVARLADPAPGEAALVNIYKSAFRAADHGMLRPWRFLVVKGPARERLGDLFLEAALANDSSLVAEKQDSIRRKPLRAPMLLVTVSSIKEHRSVPAIEQEFSAAAATQNMLLAAHAQGIGAMWRTGSMAYHPIVMKGLGLAEHEKIIGFLYLGSIDGPTRTLGFLSVASTCNAGNVALN